MACGNYWVPLLFFLMIMKKKHVDSEEMSDVETYRKKYIAQCNVSNNCVVHASSVGYRYM